ncbi:hypothetical protein ATER59S_02898 [Aquamicrobium terrae]
MMLHKRIADIEAAATFLTLMGNEKRLAIMAHLMDTELSVGAIADKVELSQSALSQHLAKLRTAGLVQTRRDRQMIYYSCDAEAVRRLLSMLSEFFGTSRLHQAQMDGKLDRRSGEILVGAKD